MFNIGDKLTKENYTQGAIWANYHSAKIVQKLDGYYIEAKPEPTLEEKNEAIRQTREQRYIQTSDKLKADYDEAVARNAENVEELKTVWLESKDKIREENPYIIENVEEVLVESESLPIEEPEAEIPVEEPESSSSLEDAINSVLEK